MKRRQFLTLLGTAAAVSAVDIGAPAATAIGSPIIKPDEPAWARRAVG